MTEQLTAIPSPEALEGEEAPPSRTRRRRLRLLAAVALLAAGTTLAVVMLGTGDNPRRAATAGSKLATATVERGDLVADETLSGTLGYSGRRAVSAGAAGVVTGMPTLGTVKERGESLYEIDGRPTAFLLYGSRPAWRRLKTGDKGADVRQLEENLKALGYDPYGAMTVDGYFGDATAAAVIRFHKARGMTRNGVVELGEVVFLPGKARVAARKASLGDRVAVGSPVVETTTTKRVVSVALDADRQGVVRRGQPAEIELPNGRTVRGRVTNVGRVARGGGQDDTAKISVTVGLRGKVPALDQAPVGVRVQRTLAKDQLLVPISALVAGPGGGYRVEVVDRGRRRFVKVRTGSFASGYVAVAGRGLRAGLRVVVAQ